MLHVEALQYIGPLLLSLVAFVWRWRLSSDRSDTVDGIIIYCVILSEYRVTFVVVDFAQRVLT